MAVLFQAVKLKESISLAKKGIAQAIPLQSDSVSQTEPVS